MLNQTGEGLCLLADAVNLSLVVRRQCKAKDGAARLTRVNPQSPRMGIDDGAANRESKPQPAALGGVEGLENSLTILRGDTWPRVAYGDE